MVKMQYLRGVWWTRLGGGMMVGRGFVMVKDRGVGQVCWGVARWFGVALR